MDPNPNNRNFFPFWTCPPAPPPTEVDNAEVQRPVVRLADDVTAIYSGPHTDYLPLLGSENLTAPLPSFQNNPDNLPMEQTVGVSTSPTGEVQTQDLLYPKHLVHNTFNDFSLERPRHLLPERQEPLSGVENPFQLSYPGFLPFHFTMFERRWTYSKMKFPVALVHLLWGDLCEIVLNAGEAFYYFAKWRMMRKFARDIFQSEWCLVESELESLIQRTEERGLPEVNYYRLLRGSFKDIELVIDGQRLWGRIVTWATNPRFMDLPATVIFEVYGDSPNNPDGTRYALTKLPQSDHGPPVMQINGDLTFDLFSRLPDPIARRFV